MRKKLIWIAPLAIVGMAVFIAIGGELVMHLWNWLLPMLFGWRQITFWQAVGLLVLCRILFGGVSGRGLHRSNFRRQLAERCQRITPEGAKKSGQSCDVGVAPSEPRVSMLPAVAPKTVLEPPLWRT